MMELKLVSFETAKKLKEVGFDVHVKLAYHKAKSNSKYWNMEKGDVKLDPGFSKDFNVLKDEFWETTSAPTLALAQMWVREKYNIHVSAGKDVVNKLYFVEIDVWDHTRMNESLKLVQFDSYDEALEAGILECVNLLKNKQHG